MSVHLYPEDCHAIDLLLDQGIRAAGGTAGKSMTASASAIAGDRLAAVQRVLALLELMPTPEPPANLISKTLKRIENAPAPISGASLPRVRPHRNQPLA